MAVYKYHATSSSYLIVVVAEYVVELVAFVVFSWYSLEDLSTSKVKNLDICKYLATDERLIEISRHF